jgi:hypothetical protein
LLVATTSTPAAIATFTNASLRCRSSGSPWSHSSTSTRSRPKPATSRSSAARAAAGPSRTSAAGTVPLRQPVSTNQLSLRALASGWTCTGARDARTSASTLVRGAPFSPAICASLMARARRA